MTSFPGCINIIKVMFMHPGKDYVYASREGGQAEREPEGPNPLVYIIILCKTLNKYDLLAEYMGKFSKDYK